MIRRNNNSAIIAAGASSVAHYLGEVAFSSTGKKLIWDGVKYIGSKLWNRRNRNNNKNRDAVGHPGAFAGAVAAPVAISRIIRASRPKFVKSKGSVTIIHRELIGQFDTSTGLVVNSGISGNLYRVNPSNAVLFPWLQSIASNFDQYKFERVRLQYVPLCGTSTTGRVALYFDKDSQDAEPGDRVELANMAHLTETSPWAEASLNLPIDNTKRFVNDSSTTDAKLIDLGQIGVGTYGSSGVAAAGDVFIHYAVTFYEPQPSAGLVATVRFVDDTFFKTGPGVFTTSFSSTSLLISFNSFGTYLVAVQLKATTITGDSETTDVVENSHFNALSGGNFTTLWNITVNRLGAGLAITGTVFGDANINVVRAKKENSVILP
nr:structural protein [Tolivirales sp.]